MDLLANQGLAILNTPPFSYLSAPSFLKKKVEVPFHKFSFTTYVSSGSISTDLVDRKATAALQNRNSQHNNP